MRIAELPVALIHAGEQTNSCIRISLFKAIVASKFDGDFTGLYILVYQVFGLCRRVSGDLDEIIRDDAFISPIGQDVLVFYPCLLYSAITLLFIGSDTEGYGLCVVQEWLQWRLIGLGS